MSKLAVLLLLLPAACLAQRPVIEGIGYGEFQHGGVYYLEGTGFGPKPSGEPLIWDTVDNQPGYKALTEGETILTSDNRPGGCPSCPWPQQNTALYGGGEYPIVWSGTNSRHSHSNANMMMAKARGGMQSPDTGGSGPIYFSFWYYHSDYDGQAGVRHKIFEIESGAEEIGLFYNRLGYSKDDDGDCIKDSPNGSSYVTLNDLPAEWVFFEVLIWNTQSGGVDGCGDSRVTVKRNGAVIHEVENVYFEYGQPFHLIRFVGYEWGNGGACVDCDVYMDDLYFDNTFSRVMIGDAPNLANCTKLEMQGLIDWLDTPSLDTAGIVFNQGAFGDTEPFYFFLINAFNIENDPGDGPYTVLPPVVLPCEN